MSLSESIAKEGELRVLATMCKLEGGA